MAVKILIKRKIPEKIKEPVFNTLIRQLRLLATQEPGYISGETLLRIDKPNEYLVISTWKDVAAWNMWKENKQRTEIQRQIDALLKEPTQYEVYGHL